MWIMIQIKDYFIIKSFQNFLSDYNPVHSVATIRFVWMLKGSDGAI